MASAHASARAVLSAHSFATRRGTLRMLSNTGDAQLLHSLSAGKSHMRGGSREDESGL